MLIAIKLFRFLYLIICTTVFLMAVCPLPIGFTIYVLARELFSSVRFA